MAFVAIIRWLIAVSRVSCKWESGRICFAHDSLQSRFHTAIPLVTPGYTLVQATVHQRHMDRWVYSHSLISNYCWPKQKNSTDQTMARECEFNRSSVWEAFPFEGDPYAAPSQGSCNPKQITEQGLYHGKLLGDAYRKMMLASAHDTSSSGTTSLCGPSNVGLEMDSAEKNQRTAMQVYLGLCGTLPTPEQYPAWSSIDNGTVAKGKPFFLSSGICASPALKNLSAIAKAAIEKDPFATELLQTSAEVAAATGKAKPNLGDAATLLDNVEDCVVVHACHGLDDVPKDFHGSSLLERVDVTVCSCHSPRGTKNRILTKRH